MSRPNLPTTRDERIALAQATIAGLPSPDEQIHPEHQRAFDDDRIVVFQVQVAGAAEATLLADEVAEALLTGTGFSAVSFGAPKQVADGYVCSIRVPVGAP